MPDEASPADSHRHAWQTVALVRFEARARARSLPALACLLQVCLAHPPSSPCPQPEHLSSVSAPREPGDAPCHWSMVQWCSLSSPWLIRQVCCAGTPDAPSCIRHKGAGAVSQGHGTDKMVSITSLLSPPSPLHSVYAAVAGQGASITHEGAMLTPDPSKMQLSDLKNYFFLHHSIAQL